MKKTKKAKGKTKEKTKNELEMKICEHTKSIANTNCRVTNCSPHLSRNRKWVQQAQYNRFVREWVKELG